MNFETFLVEFQKAKETAQPFVVVTLVGNKGSVPQILVARLLLNESGYLAGTIGGGKLEKAAIEKGQELLKTDHSSFFQEWNLQNELGMSCGGAVSLFFEVHQPKHKWQIVIFGAGHVVQELSRVLLRLDCQISCVDARSEWLEKLPNSPKLTKIKMDDVPTYVDQMKDGDFVVIATMGHSTDLPILQRILKSTLRLPYLGVLGSDVKAGKLRTNMLEAGISQTKVDSYFCPMGEAIGDNTPPEMAISIVAQLLKAKGQLNQQETIS